MGLAHWRPSQDIMTLREAMNRMLDEQFRGGFEGERVARMPLDAYSTDDEIVVEVSLPGVKADDVEITYEGDTLTITGQTTQRMENVNYLFAERFNGTFRRTLQLNVPVDSENIEATFEDGVLTLVLPKTEASKPKVIKPTVRERVPA